MTFQDYTLFFLFSSVFSFQIKKFIIDQKISFCILWIARLSFCGFIACTAHVLNLTNTPIVVDIAIVMICIFLFESFRAWYLISQFIKLELPLFPHFQFKSNTIIWPQEESFESLRILLKKQNFQTACGLTTLSANNEICLLSSVFLNTDNNIRLQIIFSPIRFGKNIVSTIATSYTEFGEKIITHNVNLPFGCLIHNDKFIKKFPLKSSKEILSTHIKRIKNLSKHLLKFDSTAIVDNINDDIKFFKEKCLAVGVCTKSERSSNPCLSHDGGYALWKNILKISYIGIA